MREKYSARVVATVLVIRNGEVLLVKRKNTGYMDGFYAMPGGHLEQGETIKEGAARELKEETGLIVAPKDLHLFQILQNEDNPSQPYISFRFYTEKWQGKPTVGEPERSEEVGFFNIHNLPKVSPYVRLDLEVFDPAEEVTIRYIGPGELKQYES